jgi:hypothetical protein
MATHCRLLTAAPPHALSTVQVTICLKRAAGSWAAMATALSGPPRQSLRYTALARNARWSKGTVAATEECTATSLPFTKPPITSDCLLLTPELSLLTADRSLQARRPLSQLFKPAVEIPFALPMLFDHCRRSAIDKISVSQLLLDGLQFFLQLRDLFG